jgi:O-antigen ligase
VTDFGDDFEDRTVDVGDLPIPGAGPAGYIGSTPERVATHDADDTVADAMFTEPVLADTALGGTVREPGLTFVDKLIATVVFFVPFAYYHLVNAPFSTMKAALIVLLTGPGLFSLVRLLRSGDRAARWGAAYAAAALVSTLASGNIALSLAGPYAWFNGWFLTLAIVAVWALGRSLTAAGRRAVTTAIVLSAALMSALAWLGSRFNIWTNELVYLDRAQSLTGNPVYLSIFLSGALAVALMRAGENRMHLVSVFLIGSGLEFAGGRAGLGAAVFVIFAVLVFFRARHLLAAGASIAGGILAAVVGTGTSAATRVGADGGGLGSRPAQWKSVWDAFQARPLLGWGPGRIDAASGRFRPLGYGPCRSDEALNDAHNFLLHHLGTVGIIGTILMVGWIVSVARQTRGPAAIAAVAVGLNLLVEPLWAASVIPFVLLVGAASNAKLRQKDGTDDNAIDAAASGRDRFVLAAFLLAAMPAMLVLYSDIVVRKAAFTADVAPAELARKLTPDWPEMEDIVARSTILGNSKKSLETTRDTSWDQDDDITWLYLGNYEARFGSPDAARAAYQHALTLNPSSLKAAYALLTLAESVGDKEAATFYRDRLHTADKLSCSPAELATLRPV